MNHSFDADIAKKLGVHAAILYNGIEFWCATNQANNKNKRDGRHWVFNSVSAWSEIYPYLTEKQIRTALDKLVHSGMVIKGAYNAKPYDRTAWYAICPKRQMDLPKKANGFALEGEPIPVINTVINKITTTTVGEVEFSNLDIEAIKARLTMVGLPLDDAALKREWAYYQIAIESSQDQCRETIEKWTKRFIHALCKQREKKKVFNRVNPFLPNETGELVSYDEIVKLYHEILPNNPKCEGLDSSRQGDIASLVESGEIPTTVQWRNYFKYCAKSPFIVNGINGWVADLSWLIRMKNYLSIKEGLRHGQVG